MRYKLIKDEFKLVYDRELHPIEAMEDCGEIRKGDRGGWIESESNLSQDGKCWIFPDSCVYDSARVTEDAWVKGESYVYDYAKISGKSVVMTSDVSYHSTIENAVVIDSDISGHAKIFGGVIRNSDISDHVEIVGTCNIRGSELSDDVSVKNAGVVESELSGDVEILDSAYVLKSTLEGEDHVGVKARVLYGTRYENN